MGKKSGPELLPGTLDLLILQTLASGSQHGYGIAHHLKTVSDDVLQVGESSLYPALQRLLLNGWVEAAWGTSENNRRARLLLPDRGRPGAVDAQARRVRPDHLRDSPRPARHLGGLAERSSCPDRARRNASVRGHASSVARRLAASPSWAFRNTVAPS